MARGPDRAQAVRVGVEPDDGPRPLRAGPLLGFSLLLIAGALAAGLGAARLSADRLPRRASSADGPIAPRDVLVAAILWFAIAGVVAQAFRIAFRRPEGGGDFAMGDVVALLTGHALFFFVVAAYVSSRYGARLADWGFRRPRPSDVLFGLLAYVASLPGWGVASALTRLLAGELPVQRSVEAFRESSLALRSLLGVAAVISAPVVEELLFRGIVFGGLRAAIGAGPALVASSILFGLLHADAAFLPLAWLGAVLAFVYHRTGSLWVPAVVHAAHNLAMLAVLAVT